MSTTQRARRTGTAERHQDRRQEILSATRTLFDTRGIRDVQIEDVAREAGINRAIIYRHFSGKEQLFALTIESYIDELMAKVGPLEAEGGTPLERIIEFGETFFAFCCDYPSFVDAAISLLNRPGRELLGDIGEAGMFQMGRAVAKPLSISVKILQEGAASGELRVGNPDYEANVLYVQILGLAHLARTGAGVQRQPSGMPWFFPISQEDLAASLRRQIVALAKA